MVCYKSLYRCIVRSDTNTSEKVKYSHLITTKRIFFYKHTTPYMLAIQTQLNLMFFYIHWICYGDIYATIKFLHSLCAVCACDGDLFYYCCCCRRRRRHYCCCCLCCASAIAAVAALKDIIKTESNDVKESSAMSKDININNILPLWLRYGN